MCQKHFFLEEEVYEVKKMFASHSATSKPPVDAPLCHIGCPHPSQTMSLAVSFSALKLADGSQLALAALEVAVDSGQLGEHELSMVRTAVPQAWRENWTTNRSLKRLRECRTHAPLRSAAAQGNLTYIMWALANGYPVNRWTQCLAMNYGFVQMLEWLEDNNGLFYLPECSSFAAHGRLPALQWARSKGLEWNEKTCEYAAIGAHLELLQWARANGCPWDLWACVGAARGGHLEVLKWLVANGCPWDHRTCEAAAERGYLEVLQWAVANGCECTMQVCCAAAEFGHVHVLQWLMNSDCPWDSNLVCNFAARYNRINVLEWARANCLKWDRSSLRARLSYFEPALHWLIKNPAW